MHFFREHFHRRQWAMADEPRCVGRHRHGRGGRFQGGFMGRGGFEGAGLRGRKLTSNDLQLLLLALLAEKPSHGYELIKTLDERSGGFYSPSPGMVYPALTYLEEIGYAVVTADGAKKLYNITEPGRAHLNENRATAEALLAQLEAIGKRMGDVRRAFGGEGRDAEENFGPDELRQARRELRQALRGKKGASPEELRRVAAILTRAVIEILGE